MSGTLYHQIYRCRKCGEEYCPVTVHSKTATLKEIKNFYNRANNEIKWDHDDMPLAPRLYRFHTCENSDFGVCDFIGYAKEVI